MKKAKKPNKQEPTIAGVVGAVNTLTQTVQDLTEAVQNGFTKVEIQLGNVEGRLDGVEYRVMALEKRTGAVEHTVEDMNETLKAVARARDKDAVAIMSYERRIRHLEKARI